MKNDKNLRKMEVTTSSGKDVEDSDQLKGLAKDSLSGQNKVEQYTTGKAKVGMIGGMSENQ